MKTAAAVSLALCMLLSGAARAAEPTVETSLLLARQRIVARDYDGAEKVLRDAQKRWPDAHGFHLLRGSVEEARNDIRAAFWEYQWELLRAGMVNPSGEEAAKRAREIIESGSADAIAARSVLEAMQSSGQNPDAALKLVQAERKKGDAFVLRVFEAELRSTARDPQAEALFRSLLATDPAFVPAHLGLARVLARAGDAEGAQAALEKAQSIDPDHWSLQQ